MTRLRKWFQEENGWKLVLMIVVALAIIVPLWIWNYHSFMDNNGKADGSFGDKFGVVNALFSGLAFAGIIITIYLQMSELKEQRNELKMTRSTFDKQLFESTFFEMLKIHNENVKSIEAEKINDHNKASGREAFQIMLKHLLQFKHRLDIQVESGIRAKWIKESDFPNYGRLNYAYFAYYRGVKRINKSWLKPNHVHYSHPEALLAASMTRHEGVEVYLSSYYRHMFQLVKYVHDAPNNYFLAFDSEKWTESEKITAIRKEKYRYIKNLRSQLSIEQQQLFALNAMSDFGKEWKSYNGVNLINEYQLIKNLHASDLDNFGVSLKDEFSRVRFYE